ncbi:hypothetical protein D4764_05G0013470 [Takifugu flavidus]|uniref:Uncharacterized protein n=1 Tax=Takifugu flavidus TaxID=433684 RepID=A0A5C6N6C6_9TELE|nr:hypothetical protein D4764_05G0013470 [Takifugu flavidus]
MLPRLEEPQREDEEGPQRRQQQRGDGMFLWGLSRKPQWQHPPAAPPQHLWVSEPWEGPAVQTDTVTPLLCTTTFTHFLRGPAEEPGTSDP